jgi:hypothetical protein
MLINKNRQGIYRILYLFVHKEFFVNWYQSRSFEPSQTQSAREMSSEGNFVQPSIPRFDGHYDHWSMLMENFLRSKEFWGLVEIGYDEPASGFVQTDAQKKKTDELRLKDLKVNNYLFQALDRTVLDTILKKDTVKDIWDAMKKRFEGNTRVKKSHLQGLRREFETLDMKFNEGVT